MKILNKSEGITAKEMYAMTKSTKVEKLSNHSGETIELDKFVLYEDENLRTHETMTVLSILTKTGIAVATNSSTFIRNFMDIVEMYRDSGEELPCTYVVGEGVSKNGRKFLSCDVAE